MRLAFLFLPFIGSRDYHDPRQPFIVSGPRFDRRVHGWKDSCVACLYYVPIHGCSADLESHGNIQFNKHPCEKFTHPYRLKKL